MVKASFEFNAERLKAWSQRDSVRNRIDKLERAYRHSTFWWSSSGELRPEFVLIHTFSHLLINQLSYECICSSSTERIYCEKSSNNLDMYGVLIYTASGDSEDRLAVW